MEPRRETSLIASAIIWTVLSTVLFYASPVLYPLEKVPAMVELLESLVSAGKIRYYGFSNFTVACALMKSCSFNRAVKSLR